MIEVTGYFSAPIRGKGGSNARRGDIRKNIAAGKKMAAKIKRIFGTLLNLYVPHDQDDLIQILWFAGKVTAKDILEGDCKIVSKKDMLIAWLPDGWLGGGCAQEVKTAERCGIPIIIFEELNDEVVLKIFNTIHEIVQKKTKKQEVKVKERGADGSNRLEIS
ncbi:MAG: hypothetical protein ACTSUO_08410 [Candidatus Thorarchaeota archaeon]